MVEGEIEAETHCVLRVGAILNARGLTFDNVVKSTIFVSDMVISLASMPFMQSIFWRHPSGS
jgi:enamine deaminase RidA (YjgF/YER057c/UK114 family)